jgi:peptidoglycan-N-acetylglucosamine deacetylase
VLALRTLALVACVAAVCLALTPARPVQAAAATPMALAFYDADTGDYSGLARLGHDHVTHLVPSGLYLAADGGLRAVGDVRTVVNLAHAGGVKVFPMIQNYRDGAFQAGDLRGLATPAGRQALGDEILRAAAEAGGDGVDLDFEQLPPTLTAAFVTFVTDLSARLHAAGRRILLDVPVDHRAYDVPRLQAAVDWILLMAYDQHSLPGMPGPIAAYPWVRAALQQLQTEAAPGKILLGLAGYGYDWGPNAVEPVSFRQALQRAGSAAAIHWDATAREPWYAYTAPDHTAHTVWFSDAPSLQPLIREAATDGLAGVGLWRLGLEDEGMWQLGAGGTSASQALSTVTIGPTRSGRGEVAGVAGLQRTGHRALTMDAPGGRVVGERYLDLPDWFQLRETAIRAGTVALTFDDGPDPRWTPRILDILHQYHAHATFFVIGSQATQHPELLARMYAEGHEVANHTYTHARDLEHAPAWRFSLELNLTQRAIEAATGHSATLFRYPYSDSLSDPSQGDESLFEVARQGYQVAGSGSDTDDWRLPGAATITARALADPDGQTVLMHDGGGDRSQTVAALPGILAGLQARGLRAVPVGEAIGEPRADAMPPAGTLDVVLGELVLGTVWLVGRGGGLWFAIVNLVALVAFARVLVLGGLGVLHWVGGILLPPGRPYRGPVTVVLPAHDEEAVIARTLQSLVDSDYPMLEIIVVDDGSRDRTVAVASSFAGRGVRVIRLRHGGKAQALRVGFSQARSPVVVALDADTVFRRSTVRRLVAPFADPRVGAVAGNPKVGNRGTLLTRFQVLEYVLTLNLERRVYSMLNCVPVVPGAVGAWRATAVARAGGFTAETLAEDTDLTLALGRAGYRVRYAPSAVAYTEAPQTLRQLGRQRNRWAFGMLQSLWKHRTATLNPRTGLLGLVAIPGLWIAQVVFPLMAPTIDLGLVLSPFFAWGPQLLVVVAVYNAALLLLCVWALAVDGEPVALALLLPVQNLFYRQFMYVVALKAVLRAMKGIRVGWTRVTRLGTLSVRGSGAP